MLRMINFLTLMQLLTHALRFFLPWIGRIIMFMVGFILTSIISFWGGVPKTVELIADEWVNRAVANGFPTEWDRKLYFVFYYLALAMVVIGWVILSYITVAFVNLIFR